MKGSLLEENMARTIGSIGESVAAGAASPFRHLSWRHVAGLARETTGKAWR